MLKLTTIPDLNVIQTSLVQSFYDCVQAFTAPPGGSQLAGLYTCGQAQAYLSCIFVSGIISFSEYDRVSLILSARTREITQECACTL